MLVKQGQSPLAHTSAAIVKGFDRCRQPYLGYSLEISGQR